jgi:hypothetical protein
MSDPKIETVQRLYEAYGRGDVEAVMAEIADGKIVFFRGSEDTEQSAAAFA